MLEWSPEVEITVAVAAALIGEQFPELAAVPVTWLARGWDNAVFTVGDRWVFRFPHRSVAVRGVEREIALLGELASRLPLPVPAPTWIGRPSEALGYPWPFFGAPIIAGQEVAECDPDDRARAKGALPLARFLRALHAPELAETFGTRLPVDPNRRADMPFRVERTEARLTDLAKRGLWQPPPLARGLLEAARALPPSRPTAVVHGDLHARHLLLDAGAGIAGIIDWGDVALADPAVDLVLLWCYLPPSARAGFREAYGPMAEPMLVRSRVLSLFLCATLALYASHERLTALLRDSIAGLERTLAD